MPKATGRGLTGVVLLLALMLGGCAHGSGFGDATPANDPDINILPASYKPEIVAAMHAYLSDPTGIRDAAIAEPALKTVGGNLRYVVCLRFNAKKRFRPCSSPAVSTALPKFRRANTTTSAVAVQAPPTQPFRSWRSCRGEAAKTH
jgi:hypothetical protein